MSQRTPPGFAPPPLGYPPGYTPEAAGGSVAWEDGSLNLFGRWFGTFKEVCFAPKPFHAAASASEDPWPAVTFSVTSMGFAGLLEGLVVGFLYVFLGGVGAIGAATGSGKSAVSAGGAILAVAAGLGIGIAIVFPILFAILGFVGPWISGGLHHLGLLMVGGTRGPYSSTVRIVGYSSAASLFLAVPGLGGMLSFVVGMVSKVVGFEEVHKCGTGKAIFGALFPYVFFGLCCCGCYLVVMATGFAASR
jgi:hypothetical protein